MKAINIALILLGLELSSIVFGQEPPRAELAEPNEPATALAKTISKSKQFTIIGSDGQVRGAIAQIAEDLRSQLDPLLDLEPTTWEHPIVVKLAGNPDQARPTSPFRMFIAQGPRLYELNAHLGQGLQLSKLERQLLQLILFELSLREVPDEELVAGMEAPAWLIEGLLEAMRFKSDKVDRKIYQKLYEDGALMGVDQILSIQEPDTLDPASRRIYSASAGALILALSSQDGGKSALAATISSLIQDPDEPRATLQQRFPGLNLGKKSLEKWWALQLATMAAPLASDTMSIPVTEQNLSRILTFRLRDKESAEVSVFKGDQLLQAAEHPAHAQAFIEAQQQLSRLSYRCFPDYRPMILEYSRILNDLARGKSKDTEQRLSNLASERLIMIRLSERARDYLDWYQITSPQATNGQFGEFLQAMEKLRNRPKKRSDPISNYMDVIERFIDPSE